MRPGTFAVMEERIVDGKALFAEQRSESDSDLTSCMSCGSHLAQRWSTPEGVAVLCQQCATLHGLGCP